MSKTVEGGEGRREKGEGGRGRGKGEGGRERGEGKERRVEGLIESIAWNQIMPRRGSEGAFFRGIGDLNVSRPASSSRPYSG